MWQFVRKQQPQWLVPQGETLLWCILASGKPPTSLSALMDARHAYTTEDYLASSQLLEYFKSLAAIYFLSIKIYEKRLYFRSNPPEPP